MNRFLQLHLLTSYPPSNLNRDDLGRPKTAVMGGAMRLRISSQSLKRAWRTSDQFKKALDGHVGIRTKEMGRQIYKDLVEREIGHKDAFAWAREIARVFGKPKELSKPDKDKLKDLPDAERLDKELVELEIGQLAHFSPEERAALDELVQTLAERRTGPAADDLKLLREKHRAADIALFGRMLADEPAYNTEAAAQVAHALSVHKVQVEDDFFTAVDELNDRREDLGAGHMGEIEFGAAVYYLYVCVDRELLRENLSGDVDLANRTLQALLECAAEVAPTGKQNSFASRAYASYVLAEKGDRQPRSLAVAFLKPVGSNDQMTDAVAALNRCRDKMDQVYGPCTAGKLAMNAYTGDGSLDELKAFITAE